MGGDCVDRGFSPGGGGGGEGGGPMCDREGGAHSPCERVLRHRLLLVQWCDYVTARCCMSCRLYASCCRLNKVRKIRVLTEVETGLGR